MAGHNIASLKVPGARVMAFCILDGSSPVGFFFQVLRSPQTIPKTYQ